MKRILSILCMATLLLTMAVFNLPASAAHTSSLINLFDIKMARPGYVNNNHAMVAHPSHYSSAELTAAAGDVFYFGPADADQSFQLIHWNTSDTASRAGKNYATSALTVADTFDNGQVIYRYAVPGAGKICFVNNSSYNDYYLVTKNQAMTVQDYHNYWDLREGQNLRG